MAGAIALAAAVLLTIPERASQRTVGARADDEILSFSAWPRDYLTSGRASAIYRFRLLDREGGERELFPGTVGTLVAATSLVPPVNVIVVPAIVTLAATVDASFGLHGALYSWLNRLPVFRAFRVPARFRAVAAIYFALLGAIGLASLSRRLPGRRSATALAASLGVAIGIDVHPALELLPVWTHGPPIVAHVPADAVIANLPMPMASEPRWHDTLYQYFSTFDWHPIVNGYSGFQPSWYGRLGQLSRDFPADATLDGFRDLGTQYFVLHAGFYHDAYGRVVAAADHQPRLQLVATDTWDEGETRVYKLVR
jgi:hypothetical protein